METRWTRIGLRTWTVAVVLFLWIPIADHPVYAFNESNIQSWPIRSLTLTGSPWRGTTPRSATRSSCRSSAACSPR